jgi:isopenicillin-N epimerase
VTILAVPAALEFWSASGGWDDVRRRQRSIVDDGASRVAAAVGTEAAVAGSFRAAMRIIRLPTPLGADADAARSIETVLAEKYRIEVSLMPLHGQSWVRVCGQIYNTPDDYDRLGVALGELL